MHTDGNQKTDLGDKKNGPKAFFAAKTLLTNIVHFTSSFLLCCFIFSLKCLQVRGMVRTF